MPARTFSADKMPFNMDENMSILNPFPSRMSGPGLLNKLISGPATPGVALEYLDVDGKKTELSYSDLHRESDSLALRLARTRCQIAQDTPGIILIYMPQCPSLYISQLAILKSGAAFCPLVLDVPEERLKFILEDTSARILLTTTAMRSQLPRLDNVFIIAVDDGLSDSITGQYQQEPLEGGMICPEPSSLAYVMYTSGSTGLPKAVCLSHQAVTQSLLAHNRYIPTFSRFLQFASPTFDVSVFEIFFPWYRGSTLVCVERSQLLGDLPGTITALNIDAAELTPSVAASLIRTRASVPTLQLLLTIGEMLNAQVVRQFGGSSDRPGILYGMYGPTEAAIHCTLQPQYAFDLPVGTIGVPLDTVSCFIIEPAKSAEIAGEIHILPIGELGELAVGGHQLADGYLNREEQTQAAFVNHPKFGNLYRTGDKARLLRNGKLECHGRISSGQVKLRGQRVELGEIEHAASKAEECHAVVASVTSGLLVLFCIADSSIVSSSGILSACQKWLPRYMIPSDIVLLDDFPYLPSGKVDRKKLESDYGSRLTQSTSAHTNMSAAAAKIALVIQDILGVSIDRQTDLSAAGLDSLKAIQVATELRGQGFDGIGALEILRAVTVLDLDDVAKSERTDDHAKDVSVDKWQSIKTDLRTSVEGDLELSQHGNIEEILPCTPLQDAMLVETARQPQAYCNSLRFSVSLEITPEQLREALFALAEKHISLRSGFRASESPHCSYTQIVWGSMHASQFSVVDEGKSEWSINDETMLLRPLHYQYKKLDAGAELLMQIHHALYDQWSIEIILEDLISILRREEVPRRPSFASFNEVFSHKKAEDQTSHIDFWQAYLSNFTFGHLPNLSPRVMPSAGLDILEHTIDVEIESLRQAATAHSCSPHVFFQAIYAVLLGSYMGVDDVTFGTVFSGRTLPLTDIENIVGPLLSTLPSRINLGEGRKFSDIMRRLQNDNREVMQHSTVSLAEIRNTCGMTPGEALFDSIFVWQDTARPSSQSSALIKLEEARDYLEFTLTLELGPTLHGVEVKATFQPNILPLPQVEIFLQQLDQLVQFVLANPDALMSELSSQCSTSILSIANPEPWLFTYETGLGSFVEKHAMESPDKLALVFAKDIQAQDAMTETLTYEQLNSQANQLANYLIAQGARPNELIGVCMEKSINLYVTILAIIKAGSGYLPLVPETPLARVRQILGDANVVLCMADTTTTSTIAGLSECHAIDVTNIDYSRRSISNPVVPFKPTNIAYAVFTSGTTGKPKGVLVTQENILSNLDVLSKIYPVEEESRLLQACNQAFDVSVFEIFFTWYTGMCLCSASKDVLFRNIEAAINVLNITHLSLTPTVAALLNPTHIPKVKFLVTAGEAVTRQVHSAWAGNGLYQGYGPSETTNICTVNAAVEADHVINNIGRPFENTSAFVLTPDPGFHVVPTGGLGELCFGGQQVFRGYQNMAELTRSRIIDHPKYGRIYRSGDLGRMLHDGTILIQGRTDDQRKLRGQRVELGEITSCLLQVQGVQDCAVEIVKIGNKESLLCFWIPRSNSKDPYAILPPSDSIRETIQSAFVHLADHLPVYMIPDFLVPVSAIPQTSQGKIDRRRLAIDGSALGVEDMSAYSQALDGNNETGELSETETLLRSALAEVLQVPLTSIGNSTSFFALGLDSVSAIRLATALRTRHGHNVDVSQILKRPSVSRLAASMDTNLETRPQQGSKASAINCDEIIDSSLRNDLIKQFHQRNQNVQHILPCTPLQEAMLSSGSALGESSYHNKTLFKVQGEVARLKECWETMMRRHGILRTTFVPTEYPQFPYLQVALSDCLLPWQEFGRIADISTTLCEVEHPREISSLDYSLPWSINIYTSGSSTYLLLDMHHALYDANALANLLREVEEIYRDRPLAEPISFKPFLDHMFSVNSDHANEYFDDQLRDFVPKPFDKLSNSNSGFGSISEDSNISSTVVEDFLVKHSTSMLSLVQAMWVKVLSTYQSHSDVCFGNVVSGRSVPVDGVDTLVAPCFNTIPVRIDTSRFSSNLSLIKVLHKANVGVLPYQLTPLRHIQRRISGSGRRLFESLVLLQQDSTTLDGNIWSLEGESGNMDVRITIRTATCI
jgi:amino acid adenylation domain-containing protein